MLRVAAILLLFAIPVFAGDRPYADPRCNGPGRYDAMRDGADCFNPPAACGVVVWEAQPHCHTADENILRHGAPIALPEAEDRERMRQIEATAGVEFRCNGTGAVPVTPIPHEEGSTNPPMEWQWRWAAMEQNCRALADPRHEWADGLRRTNPAGGGQ